MMFCVGYFPGTTRPGCWNHRMHQEWQKKYYRMLRLGERATRIPKPRQARKHGRKTRKTYFTPYHGCVAWKFLPKWILVRFHIADIPHICWEEGIWRHDDFIFFGFSKVYFCLQNMDSSKDSMNHEDFHPPAGGGAWWGLQCLEPARGRAVKEGSGMQDSRQDPIYCVSILIIFQWYPINCELL